MGVFAAAMGGGLTALLGFMVPRVDFRRLTCSKPARLQFPANTVDESFQGGRRVWIVNHDQRIFSIQTGLHASGVHAELMDSEHKFSVRATSYTRRRLNVERTKYASTGK